MVGGARSVVCVCACGMTVTVVLRLRWEATLIPTALCASSRAISHREMPLLEGGEGEGSATENASIVESRAMQVACWHHDGRVAKEGATTNVARGACTFPPSSLENQQQTGVEHSEISLGYPKNKNKNLSKVGNPPPNRHGKWRRRRTAGPIAEPKVPTGPPARAPTLQRLSPPHERRRTQTLDYQLAKRPFRRFSAPARPWRGQF